MTPPPDFQPLFRTSPVTELLGPIYSRGKGPDFQLGFYAQAKHANTRGFVHGGILATIADMALGYTLALSSAEPGNLVTASLTIDYAGAAKVGEWLTTRTDILRQGSRLAFANCYIYSGEQRIARASAVFSAHAKDVGAPATEGK